MLEQGSTIDPIFLGKKVGCVGVVVDAKPYGFIRLETLEGNLGDRPEPIPMFLSLKQTAGYSN
jgi:hypothetical protein